MPPEIIDPNNRKLKFHNDTTDRKRTFRPRQRIHTIFATKAFMIGYGIFLTASVLFIYTLQNGGIDNVFVLSRFFGMGIKIEAIITDSPNENKEYVFILVENIRYKSEKIANLESKITFYNKDKVIDSKSVFYEKIEFESDGTIKMAVEFDSESIKKSDRYIIETNIDGKTITNKKEI